MGLQGCPREGLPSPSAHLARRSRLGGGASLPRHSACPEGSLSIFPLFRGEAGPTSQTRKLRPQICSHYLLQDNLPCPCDWRGRVAVESHFTGKKWKPAKKTAGGFSKLRSCLGPSYSCWSHSPVAGKGCRSFGPSPRPALPTCFLPLLLG